MEAELEAAIEAGPWRGGTMRENRFYGIGERPRSAADEPADNPVPDLLTADGGIRINARGYIAHCLLLASEGWAEDADAGLAAMPDNALSGDVVRLRDIIRHAMAT